MHTLKIFEHILSASVPML